jgi:hypothetical protein
MRYPRRQDNRTLLQADIAPDPKIVVDASSGLLLHPKSVHMIATNLDRALTSRTHSEQVMRRNHYDVGFELHVGRVIIKR